MSWSSVVGYEDFYEVSTQGEVRSVDRAVYTKNGVKRNLKGKNLKLIDHTSGYLMVSLCRKLFLVHRLVAITFLDNHEGKPTVNHKDGVKTNNALSNLEWATYQENTEHAFKVGLNTHVGEEHTLSKWTTKEIEDIRSMWRDWTGTQRAFADLWSMSYPNMCRILNLKQWRIMSEYIYKGC